MAKDDLMEQATSSADFYGLLGVTFETSESDVRRAYRRAALLYHPDKAGGSEAAVEKFHLLQIAYDVLSDPNAKAVYDNARRAKKEKEERENAYEGRRRQMKEDLERRESGFFKRKREEDEAEDALQREIKRIAADNARRRKEREELLNREALEEEKRLDRKKNGAVDSQTKTTPTGRTGTTEVSDIDRSVKVRWTAEGVGVKVDDTMLSTLFARFGPLEKIIRLKDKKRRNGEAKDKVMTGTGVVVFNSVVGAHRAVEDFKKQADPELKVFDSVEWASGHEPDFLQELRTKTDKQSRPQTPASAPPKMRYDIPLEPPITPLKTATAGLRKVPSFASFSAANTPKASPFAKSQTTGISGGPSLEELTMIRLKNAENKRREAEKKKLEEQIRQEEAD